MKKIFTLLFIFSYSLMLSAQINTGNDQTICLNDTVEVIALLQAGSQGAGVDTIIAGAHMSDYTSTMTRGWYFNAQSSFTISSIMSAEDNTAGITATNQSVEIVDFGTNPPLLFPATTGSHTVLFSAIDTISGWLNCNVDIVSGNYYGIIGAKHAPADPTMYNSYGPTGPQTFMIDGNPTTATRLLLQSSLSLGSPASGSYMEETNSSIGRVNIITGGGVNWFDVNSGQMIGSGDTLNYSPAQSTFIAGMITDSTGQVFTDTMYLEVLNTNISTTGLSLCNGALILTAATGFSTYNWNGGLSTTGVLTVNNPGVYYVDYITSSGMTCQSDPITIYSGVIPISLSTPDSLFICQGDTVIIDGPTGFATYTWSTGATTASITTNTIGNYSLTATDGNGCTGTSNTTSVSISPQTITATTTGLSLCNGSVTLDAGSGFATYQWYNNGIMMINSTQTLVVTTGGAGAYHCEVVYPTGCTAISNTLSIVAGTGAFNVIISAVGSDSLCEPNGQVTLDAGNYASFLWNTTETTQQITVNAIGFYSVDVIDASGCQGSSTGLGFEVIEDEVNTSAISGSPNPTQFQTVTYSVLNTTGSTYSWTFVGGTIQSGAGTNSIDVLLNNSGAFLITVIETNINGCVGDPINLLLNVIISSIEELNSTKKLNKITDVLGQETLYRKNTPLFYIYDDGTVEQRISIE